MGSEMCIRDRFSAMPDIFDELVAAVEADHEEFSAAPELPKVARG